MKEARIIAPIYDNDGDASIIAYEARQALEECLRRQFGGFTSYRGSGSWRNGEEVKNEPVMIYDVAIPTGRNGNASLTLRAIAIGFKLNAKQQCVYVRFPDGTVELV